MQTAAKNPVKKLLFVSCALVFPAIASASNQVFIFSGASTAVSTTLTNPYDGATITLNGTYNVNKSTYLGTGTGNTLELTNSTDFITIDSADAGHLPNVQTVSDLGRIITGNGDDFVDMASANFTTLPGMLIYGGTGNETIWANSADTTITTGNGNDTIDAGPGNDIINSGTGHYTINGGAGTDTVTFQLPMSSYTITPTGGGDYSIDALNSTQDNLSNVEFAQFSDQTISLVPEPSTSFLAGAAVAGLWVRRVRGNRRMKT